MVNSIHVLMIMESVAENTWMMNDAVNDEEADMLFFCEACQTMHHKTGGWRTTYAREFSEKVRIYDCWCF